MEKKQYVKPTIERQAIYSYDGAYLSFGKENPRWLYPKDEHHD